MKNKLLITVVAAIAGATLITSLVNRLKISNLSPEIIPAKRSHHLTDVFAHAKNQSN